METPSLVMGVLLALAILWLLRSVARRVWGVGGGGTKKVPGADVPRQVGNLNFV